ncbi:MAG: type II secretion system F family protein [bacterium]
MFNPLKSNREKARFFLMLNVALRAGLPLYRTLNIMKDSLPNYWKNVIQVLSENIRRGYSLYQSIAPFKEIFEPVTLKLIAVAENTGKLDNICIYLFEYYQTKDRVLTKIVSAVTYPIFIVIFSLIISYMILVFVFPVIVNMYAEFAANLPLVTLVLKKLVDTLSLKNILVFVSIFVVVFFLMYLLIGRERIFYIIEDILLLLPIISKVYSKFIVNNFLYAFVLCIKSGLSMSEAIKHSLSVLPANVQRRHFYDVYSRISEGQSLSSILKNKPYFNKVIINFISSYEETGNIDIVDKLINYLTFDINMFLDRVIVLIEPLLISFISIFVFFIAVAVLIPMMSISFQLVQ